MLKVTVDSIVDKLTEYGMALYTDYPTKDQGHCFMVKDMIIFLDEEDDSISITFQADSKPEDVASNLMILHEIDGVAEISIMESFIYDKNNNFISGSEAHTIVRSSLIEDAFRKVAKHQAYNEILTDMKCFEC
jgi:hypothetical protein